MKKSKFLLEHSLCEKQLDLNELEKGIAEYKIYLKKFPIPDNLWNRQDTISYLMEVKRTICPIGPYEELTLFEIGNRIASDLIILSGTRKLFNQPELINCSGIKTVTLRLSNKSGLDIIAYTDDNRKIGGEGFNVAPSFFKGKLRSALKKFDGKRKKEGCCDQQAFIVFNEEAKIPLEYSDYGNEAYLQAKEEDPELKNITFIPCSITDLWDN